MADTSEPADIRPRLQTLEQIYDEAKGKRDKLARDMIATASGPRGGSGSRGVQLDTKLDGLAWVQGRTDADYLLPRLHPLFAELLLHGVANVPLWKGEPKTDLEAMEALDALLVCCIGAILTTPAKLDQADGNGVEQIDTFKGLREFASTNLMGKGRRIIELVCERGGSCPLADLAIDPVIEWAMPCDDAFNSAKNRINAKLKNTQWKLIRHDSKAKVKHQGRK